MDVGGEEVSTVVVRAEPARIGRHRRVAPVGPGRHRRRRADRALRIARSKAEATGSAQLVDESPLRKRPAARVYELFSEDSQSPPLG